MRYVARRRYPVAAPLGQRTRGSYDGIVGRQGLRTWYRPQDTDQHGLDQAQGAKFNFNFAEFCAKVAAGR